ncbi:MAG: tetratricopeptide repeat protein [Lutibacter sp.]
MKRLVLIFTALFFTASLFAQENALKEKALEEFKNEHYNEAIILLEQALEKTKDDAEIYYYLGFFNHYRAYDSRPLNGYNFSYSEKIFEYLNKAIELKPDYGDAKYFYGAECSANAFVSMRNYDLDKLKYFYKRAFDKGAYPDWLLEFGKNLLNSCDINAILFTAGNADFDVCSYLQLHQNYRTDITIIPIGYIDRPWYVKFLKQGLKGAVKKIILNLSDDQIYDIHPYKWKNTAIQIPLISKIKEKYNLDENYQMIWTMEPDLFSNRIHSKLEREIASERTYLSPQKAILLQIVEDNYQYRPIYFSNSSDNYFLGGLDKYFKNCGLVSELTPLKTAQTTFDYDHNKIIILLQNENLKKFHTIKENDIPRISKSVSFDYYSSIFNLSQYYYKLRDKEKYNELIEIFKDNMMVDFNPDYEQLMFSELEKMINE